MKKQRGITLIALVITIIVLLILAGVSISLVMGQNGVLNKAQKSVKDNRDAEVVEQIKLAYSAYEMAKIDNTREKANKLAEDNLKEFFDDHDGYEADLSFLIPISEDEFYSSEFFP